MASILGIILVPDLIATAYFWFIPFLENVLDMVGMALSVFGISLFFREPIEDTMEWFLKNIVD